MDHEILCHGPGYTIARAFNAETLVPYGPAARADGNINHGWIDLRDAPEQVASIPEALKSVGLTRLLQAIAQPGSKLMSGGCECAAFDRGVSEEPRWQVGGFVTVMFREPDRNVDPQNFVSLASSILKGIVGSDSHRIGFEMMVEPLKLFFGRTDCYDLLIRPMGFGTDEASGWSAFNYAAEAAAEAVGRVGRTEGL